jgi:hypothetical protein
MVLLLFIHIALAAVGHAGADRWNNSLTNPSSKTCPKIREWQDKNGWSCGGTVDGRAWRRHARK